VSFWSTQCIREPYIFNITSKLSIELSPHNLWLHCVHTCSVSGQGIGYGLLVDRILLRARLEKGGLNLEGCLKLLLVDHTPSFSHQHGKLCNAHPPYKSTHPLHCLSDTAVVLSTIRIYVYTYTSLPIQTCSNLITSICRRLFEARKTNSKCHFPDV
jgi:hypothetical protein